MGKNSYLYGNEFSDFLGIMGNGGVVTSFFDAMFKDMAKREHCQKLINAGVEVNEENKRFGVPTQEIPLAYLSIDFISNKYYVCEVDDETNDVPLFDVYKKDIGLLFTAEVFEYLGKDDLFLVRDKSETHSSLFVDANSPLSEPVFRTHFTSKFEKNSDFCILGYKEFSKDCVINRIGEVVYVPEKSYNSLYLYGNVLNNGDNYINLFSGEAICKKSYSSSLNAGNLMFVESEDQVYKIDTLTGEYEVFGEPKIKPSEQSKVVIETLPQPKEESLPKALKQGRNDKCACGSGLKFKNCCGK
jgi:hypothetical protein